MQKFGLQRNSHSIVGSIEAELVKEQASSLGRAGRKLSLSLEQYQNRYDSASDEELKTLISVISKNVWELMVQREFVGFIEGNLEWVKSNYLIPEQALSSLEENA